MVVLDLGIATAHTAVVLRTDGTEVCRGRCSPTVESFTELEAAALRGAPRGPAWRS